jgi:hypothetical protein
MRWAGQGFRSTTNGQAAYPVDRRIVPPQALVRAGLAVLPAIIRVQGERASRRFIEFFTATIRNRNTRAAYARAVKQFLDWCEADRRLELHEIEPITVAAYVEQLGDRAMSRFDVIHMIKRRAKSGRPALLHLLPYLPRHWHYYLS